MHNKIGHKALCFRKNGASPAFSSPSSCLPEDQQEELEARIKETNTLLLNLALSNQQPEEGRRVLFQGLLGQWVEVLTGRELPVPSANSQKPSSHFKTPTLPKKRCGKKTSKQGLVRGKNPRKGFLKKKQFQKPVARPKAAAPKKTPAKNSVLFNKYSGRVHLVGRDFVLLKRKKQDLLIPFSSVHSVTSFKRFSHSVRKPALLDADPCLQQALILNFGETVASSPELIQLFFKMSLPIFLLQLLDQKVKVVFDGKKLTGCLRKVDKEALTVFTTYQKELPVPFSSIQYIALQ